MKSNHTQIVDEAIARAVGRRIANSAYVDDFEDSARRFAGLLGGKRANDEVRVLIVNVVVS